MLTVERVADGVRYCDLAEAVIKRFSVIIGSERALSLAKNVPGLTLDAEGHVDSSADADALERLVRRYHSIGGTVAVLMMKRTVATLARDGNLVLPGILR